MHGEGHRRNCPECGQSVAHLRGAVLAFKELRGPRNITSSDVDRIFDDGGRRFLVIEEKTENERPISHGQKQLLSALARLPMFTVWLARGTPERLSVYDWASDDPAPFLQDITFDQYQEAVAQWFAFQRSWSA